MKITRSTTVEQLKEFLNANFMAVQKKDKDLADSIAYAAQQVKKDPKSVKKAEFADLAKQVIAKLGDKVVDTITTKPKLVVENSSKPKLSATKDSKTADSNKKPDAQPKANKSASDNKTGDSKPKPVPEVATADAFPETIEYKTPNGEAFNLTRVNGIETLDELEELTKENSVFLAFYWSKAQIKQFNYGSGLVSPPKGGFQQNLDLASLMFISEQNPKQMCYSLSVLTEALYHTPADALEEIDGVRYSMGIEYQIYVQPLEEAE